VFNAASKLYFTIAGVAIVCGFAYVLASGDRVGFTALVMSGFAAAGLGVAAFVFVPREPLILALDEAADSRPADATDIGRPSVWPAFAAVAVALVAAGAATESFLILAGVVLGIIATFGWFGQAWREHASWTPAMTDRLHQRFIVPIGLPGTVVALVGIGVVSLSRLFLALPREVAPFVGALIAFSLLGVFQLLSRRNVGRGALGALAAVAAALVLAAGVAGALKGARTFEAHAAGGITLAAQNLAFDTDHLDLTANEKVALHFVNKDSVPHNLAILESEGGKPLFTGKVISQGETTYEIGPLVPGSYFFQCDVHPAQMKGAVKVSEPAAGATTTSVATGH
jgi:plastocyanin